MKKNLKNYLIILTTLLLFTFFVSLILTMIQKKQLITYNTSLILANSLSYLLLAIFSFILGLKVRKNGLIHGILLSLIMILLTIIIGNSLSSVTTIIKIITKSVIIIFFTILGVNKKNS